MAPRVVSMFEIAETAVTAALAAGASYADARAVTTRFEEMSVHNSAVEQLRQTESAGLGVRALVGSSWGFFATPNLSGAAVAGAGRAAAGIARASAMVAGAALQLGPARPVVASWAGACIEDPFAVSLMEKGDLLVSVTAIMRAAGVPLARASYLAWDTEKWFVSSEGHRIDQRIRECGAWMSATAVGDDYTQVRSYPGIRGQFGTGGWELVRDLDLPGNAARVADEALALLSAPQCPATETTLILGADQMGLQLHESVGHATELDRILGWEAAFAGTSWLDLEQLGSLRFGSEQMNVVADATLAGGLGSFGYDDEGTVAQRIDIVKNGIWTGVLSGRDSAALAGLESGGCVRGHGFNGIPMVRMTNVGLLPGDSSLEEMIATCDDGIYMDTNRSYSIDDRRLNFQFGCEIGWEIKNGKRARMLRNPTYSGVSPRFWGSLDAVGGPDECSIVSAHMCGKGQPSQLGHTGHQSAPARFQCVRVGVHQ